jgi:RimJ/RimL family protein N-acetyltransferase
MIELVSVYAVDNAVDILYELLKERTQEQCISHKELPTEEQHYRFVMSNPYEKWYLIHADDKSVDNTRTVVGSIYLTRLREIGIFIFEKHYRKGYGRAAVVDLMNRFPGRFLANINPENGASIQFFKDLGARHIQNTYEIKPPISMRSRP